MLRINTVLDDAASNSGQGISDVLAVTGNAATGSGGPTHIVVTPTEETASAWKKTSGKGIKVAGVEGSAAADVFVLGRALAAGGYEYVLKTYVGAGDSNWYLVNNDLTNPDKPFLPGKSILNPAIGAYLANQMVAVAMFQQILFDRLVASAQYGSSDASKKFSGVWMRVVHGRYDIPSVNAANRTCAYTFR